jgi:DNA-binding response OmpR family regulator
LLVEDDHNLSAVLKDYLEMLGYMTFLAKDGEEGLKAFMTQKADLCILDVMMPKKDGFTLAREIRERNEEVPLIFLTAKGLKDDRIEGFKSGCDDYITKPFSSEELSLRIEAILKRCTRRDPLPQPEERIIRIGRFEFDPLNMTLQTNGQERILTRKEASLLKLLYLHRNSLLKREEALLTIWGDDDYFIGRSMDVFIAKLRKYLKEDPSISIINVHGTGFKLEIKE